MNKCIKPISRVDEWLYRWNNPQRRQSAVSTTTKQENFLEILQKALDKQDGK